MITLMDAFERQVPLLFGRWRRGGGGSRPQGRVKMAVKSKRSSVCAFVRAFSRRGGGAAEKTVAENVFFRVPTAKQATLNRRRRR